MDLQKTIKSFEKKCYVVHSFETVAEAAPVAETAEAAPVEETAAEQSAAEAAPVAE